MSERAASRLDVARLQALLQGARLGLPLHYREVTESTNDDAARLGREGAPEGTTVIADAQTRGRGRQGRTWVSPPNVNVYVSVLLRPAVELQRCPQIGIAAGLAALEAIRPWLPEAALKWPNDVLVRGRKLCGVLAEITSRDDAAVEFVVVGIGVNVNSEQADFPPELRAIATSMRVELGRPIDREAFVANLLRELAVEYDRWRAQGFEQLRERWQKACGTIGQIVEVDTGTERFSGTVLGLDGHGCLRVRRADGTEAEVVSGDVRLRESSSAVR